LCHEGNENVKDSSACIPSGHYGKSDLERNSEMTRGTYLPTGVRQKETIGLVYCLVWDIRPVMTGATTKWRGVENVLVLLAGDDCERECNLP
jgi:hypothetical protein